MKTLRSEPLSAEAFLPYGFYGQMINPGAAPKFGAPPIEFYRDMVQQNLGGSGIVSFSVCRVSPRERVIDVAESHSTHGESMLPLDGDLLLQVGLVTPDAKPAPDTFRVFRVPRGTLVTFRPGVWHHAPFAAGDQPVNILIVLPERAYANDCTVAQFAAADQIGVQS